MLNHVMPLAGVMTIARLVSMCGPGDQAADQKT